MKSLITMALVLGSLSAFAAPKTYQVTGPVLDMNDATITVQKGKEKWEISRDASSKVNGEIKIGSKVTVEYVMTAKTIEVKEDKKAAKAKK
ncbi:MAG: hypothetical protein H7177_01975 [Rhizobacter sp.]|nr:hypothetical protein [Bacteriovorax sp.]